MTLSPYIYIYIYIHIYIYIYVCTSVGIAIAVYQMISAWAKNNSDQLEIHVELPNIFATNHFWLTRRSRFVVRMEFPCVALWRPEALDCRLLIPPEAWSQIKVYGEVLNIQLIQMIVTCRLGFNHQRGGSDRNRNVIEPIETETFTWQQARSSMGVLSPEDRSDIKTKIPNYVMATCRGICGPYAKTPCVPTPKLDLHNQINACWNVCSQRVYVSDLGV